MIDANSQFFAILTNVGMAKQANADALGIPWKITEMGVGDANNTDPIPNASQTTLINEWRRRPLNQLKIDPINPAVLIAEQIIPADEGGKWIREIGLYDADGDLVAVANCAPSFKPILSQGSGRTQIVRMNFIVTSTGNITLKIDPSIVLASRAYVDAAILEVLPKNKAPGEWTRVKTNDRGLVVSGDNPATLAAMGITDTYTKLEVEAMIAQASALPVGAQMSFPVNKIPPGFLERDGSTKLIALYPDLAMYLDGAFNRGDEGVGYFRLPESRGEFERGWDHGRGVDAGRAIGTYQKGSLLSGNDDATAEVHAFYNINTSRAGLGWDVPTIAEYSGTSGYGSSIFSSALFSQAHYGVARPRNVAVVMCIKAWNAPINQGNIDIAALSALVAELSQNGPVVGTARNAKMSVAAASASATVTADEVTVEGANGRTYRLKNFNQSINLASAIKGLGAMDVGAAPNSGYVALYALFNPETKTQGAVAVNATVNAAPELCAGVVPAGYSASALIGVWPTDGGGLFVAGDLEDRSFSYSSGIQVLAANTGTGATTALGVSGAIPKNAKTASGFLFVITTATTAGQGTLLLFHKLNSGSERTGVIGAVSNLFGIEAQYTLLPITTPQTLFYQAGGPATPLFKIIVNGYRF
ncbi:phage tail-collar fiber domain-containing protein [Pseudomonas sp. S2_A02]